MTTKVPGRYHGYDATIGALRESLGNLGLDRVELYLIHWPLPRVDKYVDTWRALIELREQGLTRSIGVSNFTEAHLHRIIDETGVVPAVNQIELHPSSRRSRCARCTTGWVSAPSPGARSAAAGCLTSPRSWTSPRRTG